MLKRLIYDIAFISIAFVVAGVVILRVEAAKTQQQASPSAAASDAAQVWAQDQPKIMHEATTGFRKTTRPMCWPSSRSGRPTGSSSTRETVQARQVSILRMLSFSTSGKTRTSRTNRMAEPGRSRRNTALREADLASCADVSRLRRITGDRRCCRSRDGATTRRRICWSK